MNELVTEHNGIKITYEERTDSWLFELRGRERRAGSLASAKEKIDAPEPKDKKPFKRQQAFQNQYGTGWRRVDVTSIAESR